MKKTLFVCLGVLCLAAPGWAGDLNLWTARGNPRSVVREVTHAETTNRVTVFFDDHDRQIQSLPILCPPSLFGACLLGASPTSTPSLLAACSYVPYADVTVVGDPVVKRVEIWYCAIGVSQCQTAEAWVRDASPHGLELVATGGGGPTTGCTAK